MIKKILLLFVVVGVLILFGCKKDEADPEPIDVTVTDIDGNVYGTVMIGTQTWMKENLTVTQYNNGDDIPEIKNDNEWVNQTAGARCDYANNKDNAAIYGKLYNYYVIKDNRNVCPAGWHVPNDEEWATLVTNLSGIFYAGGSMKEAGMAHWKDPNTAATNLSGFTALPSGYRDLGFFSNTLGEDCYWWTSTEEEESVSAWYRNLYYNQSGGAYPGYASLKNGFSIRCVKD